MFQLPKRRMLKGEMRDAEKPGLQSVPAPSAAAEARGRGRRTTQHGRVKAMMGGYLGR